MEFNEPSTNVVSERPRFRCEVAKIRSCLKQASLHGPSARYHVYGLGVVCLITDMSMLGAKITEVSTPRVAMAVQATLAAAGAEFMFLLCIGIDFPGTMAVSATNSNSSSAQLGDDA